jgi:putative ABC transport system substrate-binding protein
MPEMFAARAAELVALSPDVIVAPNSQAVAAAIAQTATIPIVMLNVSHPVEAGFIKSLVSSGTNVTGTTNQMKDVDAKLTELLRETRPGIASIGVIFTPSNAGSVLGLEQQTIAARSHGVTVVPIPLNRPADLDGIPAILDRERPQALVVHAPPIISLNLQSIAKLAVERRLPTVGPFKFMVRGGLLMSYGPDGLDSWRSTAVYVDKLLRGESASNLPIEQPKKFELVISLTTAKALGIDVPPALLARADEVIE